MLLNLFKFDLVVKLLTTVFSSFTIRHLSFVSHGSLNVNSHSLCYSVLFTSLLFRYFITNTHLSFFPASYSQYKSEDDGTSSATCPGSSGSGQTYTPTLTPTATPTPTRTATSNSPSNNAATKTGKTLK